ncbi:Uncharacterised protein [Mycobacteroides abscessus subsp. abscessus]|nr:Uncharacterised protein [Mycobacteroides abscessus subsp. abscessus]
MRALFFQISTSCSNPILTQSPSATAVCIAASSGRPGAFSTMMPYCNTNEFASIG